MKYAIPDLWRHIGSERDGCETAISFVEQIITFDTNPIPCSQYSPRTSSSVLDLLSLGTIWVLNNW